MKWLVIRQKIINRRTKKIWDDMGLRILNGIFFLQLCEKNNYCDIDLDAFKKEFVKIYPEYRYAEFSIETF